ncbi:TRAP transporter substrate-binding protein DctP [Chloroflexota bacterium]
MATFKSAKLVLGVGLLCMVILLFVPVACTKAPTPAPAPAPAPAPIEWKVQTVNTLTTWGYTDYNVPFVDMVNERSKGRLVLELFSAGAIVGGKELFAAVQGGALPMGMAIGSYNKKQVPEGDIEQGLPGTFSTMQEHVDFYMDYKGGEFYKLLDEAYRQKGVHLLKSCAPYPNTLITRKTISSLDDLKGKKVRGSGSYAEVMKELGAAPVTLTYSEIFMALQLGTIDATINGAHAIGAMKFWDVAEGIVFPMVGPSANDMFVNLEAYNKLPSDLRDIIDEAAREATYEYTRNYDSKLKELLEVAKNEHGVSILTLPDEEYAKMRKAAGPVHEKAAARTTTSAKLVALIKEYIAEKK